MHLINATNLELVDFPGSIPPYAILSHTWSHGEVSYQTFQNVSMRTKFKGWVKIERACKQALADKLNYLWVDTCCIDKTSSAELSEAINSMFTWYENAVVCYAFLEDVVQMQASTSQHDGPGMPMLPEETIERPPTAQPGGPVSNRQVTGLSQVPGISAAELGLSRWFTRGWTLQELLAPAALRFYSSDWQILGTKHSLAPVISSITRVDEAYLSGSRSIYAASIAKRMSWAADRHTTRTEDIAYCLMGLFNVNMPLLYGEGIQAFLRLQEEILNTTNDQSLFVWNDNLAKEGETCGLLAKHPRMFREYGDVRPYRDLYADPDAMAMTDLGLSLTLSLVDVPISLDLYIARLRCFPESSTIPGDVAILLRKLGDGRLYTREEPDKLRIETEQGSATQIVVPQSTLRQEATSKPTSMVCLGVRSRTKSIRTVAASSISEDIGIDGLLRIQLPDRPHQIVSIIFIEVANQSHVGLKESDTAASKEQYTVFLCSGATARLEAYSVRATSAGVWRKWTKKQLFAPEALVPKEITKGRRLHLETYSDYHHGTPTEFWVAFDSAFD